MVSTTVIIILLYLKLLYNVVVILFSPIVLIYNLIVTIEKRNILTENFSTFDFD